MDETFYLVSSIYLVLYLQYNIIYKQFEDVTEYIFTTSITLLLPAFTNMESELEVLGIDVGDYHFKVIFKSI